MKIFLYSIIAIVFFSAFAKAGDIDYAYDEAGRLSGVLQREDGGRISYIYDGMGNLVCQGNACDIYVRPESCGGKKPCYGQINAGIKAAGFGAKLNIAAGHAFAEDISMTTDCELEMEGGWNADFSNKSGFTSIEGTLTISDGEVTLDGIVLE